VQNRKRNRKKVVFLTADQLEAQADMRTNAAKQLPEGEAKGHELRSAEQLRLYAFMKRALAPPTVKSRQQNGR
jgi:hypothetical protein